MIGVVSDFLAGVDDDGLVDDGEEVDLVGIDWFGGADGFLRMPLSGLRLSLASGDASELMVRLACSVRRIVLGVLGSKKRS